ncbi:MAG: hypothetical protein UY41_C0008G0018 [Candidatus Moranbacteria bacterium GW2011_GWE1_49_15]|nr:MAG: hypothetical protein UX75_C0008G0013 [Candidatus Moranbacteria bacterium GW2011_GWE2_47_10]KKW07186.1 MAG: hypothetical protein UY41_C0008G0018 [Candidatus Moranbacteria bacterium GW2011_GWE1_49_15]
MMGGEVEKIHPHETPRILRLTAQANEGCGVLGRKNIFVPTTI